MSHSIGTMSCLMWGRKPRLKEISMKKLTLIAALAAMTATPAMAQFNDTVSLSAEVPVECTVTNLDSAVDFSTVGLKGQAAIVSNTGIDVFCNTPSVVSFSSANGGLTLDGVLPVASSPVPGFATSMDYTAEIVEFGQTIDTATLPASGVSVPLPPLDVNNIKIKYDTVKSTLPLLSGTYSDTFTITLSPGGV